MNTITTQYPPIASLMWRPTIPLLAERFTVIAPDLPNMGDSAVPAGGLDMTNAVASRCWAIRIATKFRGQAPHVG